jgi:hypothetical protein
MNNSKREGQTPQKSCQKIARVKFVSVWTSICITNILVDMFHIEVYYLEDI